MQTYKLQSWLSISFTVVLGITTTTAILQRIKSTLWPQLFMTYMSLCQIYLMPNIKKFCPYFVRTLALCLPHHKPVLPLLTPITLTGNILLNSNIQWKMFCVCLVLKSIIYLLVNYWWIELFYHFFSLLAYFARFGFEDNDWCYEARWWPLLLCSIGLHNHCPFPKTCLHLPITSPELWHGSPSHSSSSRLQLLAGTFLNRSFDSGHVCEVCPLAKHTCWFFDTSFIST